MNNKSVQFLYRDGDTFHFMDPNSFEQFELDDSVVGEAKDYLKDGDEVDLQFFDEKIISVELPKNLYLEGCLYRRRR